jgi:hypothetical protein
VTEAATAAESRPTRAWLIAAVLAAFVLVVDLWVAARHPYNSTDTTHLVVGAQRAVDCLRHHVFVHCDGWADPRDVPTGVATHVGPWPLLQYIPAVVLDALGVSQTATVQMLVITNALALWALFLMAYVTVRRFAPAWVPIVFVALLASPLLWYGTTSFGEEIGAAIVVGVVAAILMGARPVLVGTLVAFASMTKETNFIFVAALAVVCVVAQTESRREKTGSRRLLGAVIAGVLIGVLANTAFNVFRFGSVRNVAYLHSYERAPNAVVAVKSFAALWVAPNGGVTWFWPCSLAVIGLSGAGSIWTLRRSGRSWNAVVPAAVAGVLIVNVAAVSTWYSPFGWVAWGPRLLLTILPATVLMAAAFAGARATDVLQRILAGRLFWPVASTTILSGVPEVGVLFERRVTTLFFASNSHCVNASVTASVSRYYRCFDYSAWQKRPFLLQRGLEGLGDVGSRLVALAFVGAMITALAVARVNARRSLAEHPDDAARSREDSPTA